MRKRQNSLRAGALTAYARQRVVNVADVQIQWLMFNEAIKDAGKENPRLQPFRGTTSSLRMDFTVKECCSCCRR
jgi:hypothetical protein